MLALWLVMLLAGVGLVVLTAAFPGPVGPLPDLPGLSHARREGNRLAFDYAGPLEPLLGWLARQQVTDLRVEPLGLGPIYHRYHGAPA